MNGKYIMQFQLDMDVINSNSQEFNIKENLSLDAEEFYSEELLINVFNFSFSKKIEVKPDGKVYNISSASNLKMINYS